MASHPRTSTVTVILNSNHTRRFVLLLQPGDARTETILREARNKFRSKGLSIVFIRGGTPLDDKTMGESPTEVWVSKGEPYSGPPAKNPGSSNPGEVRVIADRSFIDDQALKQLKSIASLPGVRLAVGLPDLHPGNRFPIGCAIAAGMFFTQLHLAF
jgi:release factor H-coupled RctB family protein